MNINLKKATICFSMLIFFVVFLSACQTGGNPADPYEKTNRKVFELNDKIDRYTLKPVATAYNRVMPTFLNQGVHNFFLNLGTLPTIANDVLQFHFYQAANDVWRFAVNSTIGLLGFIDVASRIELKPYVNDFGLTLASWGYTDSTYLVLPFFGPSTIRDGIGLPIDYYGFTIYPYINIWARYGIYGVSVVDKRAQLLKFESVLQEAALDKYVFVRDAYTQRRKAQIEQNKHLDAREQISLAKQTLTH